MDGALLGGIDRAGGEQKFRKRETTSAPQGNPSGVLGWSWATPRCPRGWAPFSVSSCQGRGGARCCLYPGWGVGVQAAPSPPSAPPFPISIPLFPSPSPVPLPDRNIKALFGCQPATLRRLPGARSHDGRHRHPTDAAVEGWGWAIVSLPHPPPHQAARPNLHPARWSKPLPNWASPAPGVASSSSPALSQSQLGGSWRRGGHSALLSPPLLLSSWLLREPSGGCPQWVGARGRMAHPG